MLVGVGKMTEVVSRGGDKGDELVTRQGGHEGSWEHQMTHDVRWYGSEGTG